MLGQVRMLVTCIREDSLEITSDIGLTRVDGWIPGVELGLSNAILGFDRYASVTRLHEVIVVA